VWNLDLKDVWKLVQKGDKVTLWSMGATTEANAPTEAQNRKSVLKRAKTQSRSEDKRVLVAEYEQQLQQKHGDKYSRFQTKI
jgi:hypothetical protein